MSYCVNCGVELDKSAKKCVLCNTPVYNPKENVPLDAPTPFSQTPIEIHSSVKVKFTAIIISFIILIPNIICMLLNLFLQPDYLWFIYVLATSFLVWVTFVFPFITPKRKPYLMWAFDSLATALYIFVFYALNSNDEGWYYAIAIPAIAITSACAFYFIHWYRQRARHWTSKVLHIFVDITIILTILGICFYINSYFFAAVITLVLHLSSLCLMFFWLYANKSKKIRAWLAKKLFV